MPENKNIVTCMYCEFFEHTESSDFFENLKGKCKKQNKIRYSTDDICDYFALISGLYTTKDYPGKENRKPTPIIFY